MSDAVDLAALEQDPYPIFARLRAEAPVRWVEPLGLWYVTRHADVHAILMDDRTFTTDWPGSPIEATFGRQMLTTDGEDHRRYRSAAQGEFSPVAIEQRLTGIVRGHVEALVDGIAGLRHADLRTDPRADLRATFAARLPVRVMVTLLGLDPGDEADMRRWYDVFEAALADFHATDRIRREARQAVRQLHDRLDTVLSRAAASDSAAVRLASHPAGLTADEVKRNLSIAVFGGVSTVEALILNTLYALFTFPDWFRRCLSDPALIPAVIDETMRWMSPVQSAIRHVRRDVELHGQRLREGDTVACMLGAANRDPAVFDDPDRFDPERPNLNRHLGFAIGPHTCIGFWLAKLEVRLAVSTLLDRLPGLRPTDLRASRPVGYEFRQPRSLRVEWRNA